MKNKIIINGKFAFKTTKRPNIIYKKSEAIEKIQLKRERSVEFEGTSLNKVASSGGHISDINH
jgi:hypothetical protein